MFGRIPLATSYFKTLHSLAFSLASISQWSGDSGLAKHFTESQEFAGNQIWGASVSDVITLVSYVKGISQQELELPFASLELRFLKLGISVALVGSSRNTLTVELSLLATFRAY